MTFREKPNLPIKLRDILAATLTAFLAALPSTVSAQEVGSFSYQQTETVKVPLTSISGLFSKEFKKAFPERTGEIKIKNISVDHFSDQNGNTIPSKVGDIAKAVVYVTFSYKPVEGEEVLFARKDIFLWTFDKDDEQRAISDATKKLDFKQLVHDTTPLVKGFDVFGSMSETELCSRSLEIKLEDAKINEVLPPIPSGPNDPDWVK